MKIERAKLEPIGYRLRKPLLTHRGELRERRGYRITLHGRGPLVGLGEALPLVSSGTESAPECERGLAQLAARLEGASGTLDELIGRVEETAAAAPAARCAWDGALHGLAAQEDGVSVARLLGSQPPLSVPVNAVIGGGSLEESVAAAREAQALGFRTLKLKLSQAGIEQDEARLRAVREALGHELRLRIDANGAWSADEALGILERLAPLALEFVEQPVPAHDLAGLARLRAEAPVAIAADETLALVAGRDAVQQGELASIAVLKPMVLGGLRACLHFAKTAREHGVRCVITTTFEGWVGTALATHLAAALGEAELAHGLASSHVLETPFPPELIPQAGYLQVCELPGLGYTPAR